MPESETTPFSPTAHSPTDNPAASDLLVIEPRPLPRLGISHLFLWMLCTSLYLAATRQSLEGLSAQWETQGVEITAALQARLILRYVWLILTGCTSGAAWAGIAVLLVTRIRGGAPLLRQPGHWILLVVGIQAGVFLLVYFLSYQSLGGNSFLFTTGFRLLSSMAMVVLYTIAAWRSRFRRWTAFFATMVMQQIFDSLMACVSVALAIAWRQSILWWIMSWHRWVQVGAILLVVIAAVVLAIAIVRDIRDRQNHDWLHWLGVTIFGASAISTVYIIALALFTL